MSKRTLYSNHYCFLKTMTECAGKKSVKQIHYNILFIHSFIQQPLYPGQHHSGSKAYCVNAGDTPWMGQLIKKNKKALPWFIFTMVRLRIVSLNWICLNISWKPLSNNIIFSRLITALHFPFSLKYCISVT